MSLHEIDAKKLKEWLDKEEAVVVDVREPAEYSAQCISQAVLIPLATISKDKLPDLQGKKLVLHCELGGRGEAACKKLLAEDPTLEAYNLVGGLAAWEKAGYAVKGSVKQ